jgi:hypothetical protein
MHEIPRSAICCNRSAQYSAEPAIEKLIDQLVGARLARIEVDLAGRAGRGHRRVDDAEVGRPDFAARVRDELDLAPGQDPSYLNEMSSRTR